MIKKQPKPEAAELKARKPAYQKHLIPAAVLALGLALASCSAEGSSGGAGAAAPADVAGQESPTR